MFTSKQLLKLYMNITNSVNRLVNAYQNLQDASVKDKQKLVEALMANAELQTQLAIELGNNPAEAAAIDKAVAEAKLAYELAEAAQVKADKYAEEITKLQAAVDADVTEDMELEALIESVLKVKEDEVVSEPVITEVPVEPVVEVVEPSDVVLEAPVEVIETETVPTDVIETVETPDVRAEEILAEVDAQVEAE